MISKKDIDTALETPSGAQKLAAAIEAQSLIGITQSDLRETSAMYDDDTPTPILTESEKATLREKYLAKRRPQWEERDYIEANGQLIRRAMGKMTPREELHPLAQAALNEVDNPTLEDFARIGSILHHGDMARSWDYRQIVGSGGLAVQHLSDSVAEAANTLVLERSPALLAPALKLTKPRGCTNYLPTQNATLDIDALNGPSVEEFIPYQNLAVQLSGDSLQLANASISVYIGRQLVDSADYGAIAAAVSAVPVSTTQNELNAFGSILNSNGNLADGSALFNATYGNLLTGGSKDAATLGLAFGALRSSHMNGRDSNASPKFLLVPTEDELTAQVLVATLAGHREALEVVSVAPEYLTAGSWYVFADPADYPVILRGTFQDSGGQSLTWSTGALRPGDVAGSLRLDASHNVAYAPVARCGCVRIDMA